MPASSRSKSSRRLSSRAKPSPSSLEILRADNLAGVPWLLHGFSTRQGGISTCFGGRSLNLGLSQHDDSNHVAHNRALFLAAVGATRDDGTLWPLAEAKQIHSAIVHNVDGASQGLTGDGLLTATPGLLLGIKTADCVPVLVADVTRSAIAAFHAGWRGSLARIVEKGIGEMRRHFGSQPKDLVVAIGPSIRRCCYRVDAAVRAEFESQFSYAEELFEEVFDSDAIHVRYPLLFLNQRAPGHGELGPEIHLDLIEANRRQLLDGDVRAENITVIDGCTACDMERFFSHRAEAGMTGRMMAVIGIRAG